MINSTFKTFLSSLTVLVFVSNAFAANAAIDGKTDSLRNEIQHRKGADKIAVQLELSNQLIEKNVQEAQNLALEALSASKTLKNKNLEMRSYLILGRVIQARENWKLADTYYDSAFSIADDLENNWYKGDILFSKGLIRHNQREEISALENFNAAIQACRLSDNYRTMAATYSIMGTIFRLNGLYDRAIEYIVNSKLNYEKAHFPEGNAWSAYLLGRIYADLKLHQKALDYFHEALKIYARQAALDGNKNGVSICFEQIGLLYLEAGDLAQAHKYIDSTLQISTADKSAYGLSSAHKNLGMIEYLMGNFQRAEEYLNESLKVKEEIGDFLSLPTIHEYLGLCLLGKHKTKEGFENLRKALDLAEKNNQKKIQLNIYAKLTDAYLQNNDLKNAFDCQKKQIKIQDLLLSGDADIKIEQLQAVYEIDKQNRQIIELERQNEINALTIKEHRTSQTIMIFGISIAFLISFSIFWFYGKIRRKNRELKVSNAAKDKLFAIIAHDLRGPTGSLAAFLEHINATYHEHSQEELKVILQSLAKSADNVMTLLDSLLVWARSQLNNIEFNPTSINLAQVVKTSVSGLMQIAGSKQIDLRFELNEDIVVHADSNMVQTILRNIVSNAIKFTYRGGTVTVKSELKDVHNARITITDNGTGIDKSVLPLIFDPSNTYHTKGTEEEMSTGLGLILVKDFVEKNRGTISIESQKGQGTTVSFNLPLA